MLKRVSVVLVFAALGLAGLIAIPYVVPALLAAYRHDIQFAVPTKEKRIFITIDDAPSRATPEILAVLRKHDVPATFFVVAGRVSSPAQLREIASDGHSFGNHLRTTQRCSTLSPEEFRRDFDACSALLQTCKPARFFRPPSDFGTKAQIAYARSKGCQAVVGTVFPLDHWLESPRLMVMLARWLSVSGGVVILHDGDQRGITTAVVLDRLLPKLREAGFTFGRLEELEPSPASAPTRTARDTARNPESPTRG